MGNQFSRALADAGLITQESVARQTAQKEKRDTRRQQKEHHKHHLQTDEGRVENYSSASEFMEYVRRRLKKDGYSEGLMNIIFREAHQFADAKLPKKQRSRMHFFLCKLKEKLIGLSPSKQKPILRDGKRAFQQMNASNL